MPRAKCSTSIQRREPFGVKKLRCQGSWNALKFVAMDVQPYIRLKTDERNGFVHLWVEDNGIGIDPTDHEQIFRIFERLHGVESYPGSGIGLAIV
jgi:signal transduction histidine kinase